MAGEPAEKDTKAGDDSGEKPKARWSHLLMNKRLILFFCGVILFVLACYGATALIFRSEMDTQSHEVSLGAFWFQSDPSGVHRKIRAEFNLHLSLLTEVDKIARARLKARKFKVQQDIQQLLRQAHTADFEDPLLTELKRQLQAQINQSLGMRGAIADVLMTDLTIQVLEETPSELSVSETESIYRDEGDPNQ